MVNSFIAQAFGLRDCFSKGMIITNCREETGDLRIDKLTNICRKELLENTNNFWSEILAIWDYIVTNFGLKFTNSHVSIKLRSTISTQTKDNISTSKVSDLDIKSGKLTCDDCGTSFLTNQGLTRHLNRKYKCNSKTCQYCKSTFKSQTAYRYHVDNEVCTKKNTVVGKSVDKLVNDYSHLDSDIFKFILEVKKQQLNLKEQEIMLREKL